MAAVFGPMEEIQRIVDAADGYVVIANINTTSQAVVGGATDAVERIIEAFTAKGFNATRIPVSHAFHTSIVAPASGAVRRRAAPARPAARRTLPIVANVTGDFYPADATAETMLDYAGQQIASPVQFVKGLHDAVRRGCARLRRGRAEEGPARVRRGRPRHQRTTSSRSSPTTRSWPTTWRSTRRCAGCTPPASAWTRRRTRRRVGGRDRRRSPAATGAGSRPLHRPRRRRVDWSRCGPAPAAPSARPPTSTSPETIARLGELFAGVLEEGLRRLPRRPRRGRRRSRRGTLGGRRRAAALRPSPWSSPALRSACPAPSRPSTTTNVARLLAGQQFITAVPGKYRRDDGRHADHPPGQGRVGRRQLPADRRRQRRHQARRACTAPLRRRRAVRRRQGPRRSPRRGHPTRHRRGLRRAARRRHPAGHAATRPRPWAPSCPTAGCCPRRCATTRASSSPRRSPGTTGSPRPWRATSPTAVGARTCWRSKGCAPGMLSDDPARSPRSTL